MYACKGVIFTLFLHILDLVFLVSLSRLSSVIVGDVFIEIIKQKISKKMKREALSIYIVISLPPVMPLLSSVWSRQDRWLCIGNLYRNGDKTYRYFCSIKLKAGPFPSLGVVYLSADVVDEACLILSNKSFWFSRIDCPEGRFIEVLLFLYSLRVYFSEDFLPRWLWELCIGLPNEILNYIKFYKRAFTYMVFLDMGGICCIGYIGNYCTLMKRLKYFNLIILWPGDFICMWFTWNLYCFSIFLSCNA